MEISRWEPECCHQMEIKMRQYELIAPCHFGMEAVLKREILDMGYEISAVEDGKVTFVGIRSAAFLARFSPLLRLLRLPLSLFP